jgi:glycerol kinase
MTGRIAAIDQGTTSTRVLVAEGAQARIALSLPHAQHYPQSGWVEHDPEELVANVQACLAAAGEVEAVGIDNQGESCLAWDARTRRPISPVIVWQDNRTSAELDQLKADGAGELPLAHAGLPMDPYFSASKLAWIVRNVPEATDLLAEGRLRLGTTDAFFLDRLTGRYVTDVTTASRTSLMNIESGQWDPALCALFGVPIEALPPIVPTVGDFGSVTLNGREVPVVASMVDQQAGLYGHGCRAAGDAKITFGTGAFVLAVTGKEIRRAPGDGLLPTVAWGRESDGMTYALDGGVYTAGAAVDWVKRLGLFDDFAAVDHFEGPSAIDRGLVFVPALSGLACPHWHRDSAAAWFGLTLDTGPLDMVRAALEGIALRTAEVVAAMGEHVALAHAISIDGGMSKNDYFCQFLANVMGRAVIVRNGGERTAIGTALFAGADPALAFADHGPDHRFEPQGDPAGARARFSEAIDFVRRWGREPPPC